MSIDINDLGGPAGDSFKFANIGDKAKGTIIHAEKTERVNTFTNKDETVLIITLETGDGETIKIYPRITPTSSMAIAIRDALAKAGANSLDNGATLAVAYTDNQDIGKGQPMKVYAAAYEPPKTSGSVSAADLLG